MSNSKKGYIVVDFGSPQDKKQLSSFMEEIIEEGRPRVPFYKFFNFLFFKLKLKFKAKRTIKPDGGRKEELKEFSSSLSKVTGGPVLFFSRFLPQTHGEFFNRFQEADADEWIVFPLFPQFSYFFQGSTAKFFQRSLTKHAFNRLFFIKSYPANKNYIRTMQNAISALFKEKALKESETILFFIAPSAPKALSEEGDLYEYESLLSQEEIMKAFPYAFGRLAFYEGVFAYEWLGPSAETLMDDLPSWKLNRKNLLFIPMSFNPILQSAIETGFFKEAQNQGLHPFILPSILKNEEWRKGVLEIIDEKNYLNGRMLLPPPFKRPRF